jgi:alkylhydroperoxidase family enzyme
MARIKDVDPDKVDAYTRRVFDAQAKKWGAPLLNHLLYARRPSIFHGVRGMWQGLDASGLIDPSLQALINRRIASLNLCEFWQDINAAVCSELGVTEQKILALGEYSTSPLYSELERLALEYADCITETGREVTDELFARLRRHYDDDAVIELTAIIAWENASSKFNRALRVPSQKLWKRWSIGLGARTFLSAWARQREKWTDEKF